MLISDGTHCSLGREDSGHQTRDEEDGSWPAWPLTPVAATQTRGECQPLIGQWSHHPGLPWPGIGHLRPLAHQTRGYGTIGRRRDFEIDPI